MVRLIAWTSLLVLLSACLTEPGTAPRTESPEVFRHVLPIRIVPVGFEDFDIQALESQLVAPLFSFKMIRASQTLDFTPELLQYDVTYEIEPAPEAFAQELFQTAAGFSTDARPDAWLADYDMAGGQRVCTQDVTIPVPGVVSTAPTCEPIQRIDAFALEEWIHEAAPRHGLDAPGAGYTFYVLDSYTKGYLPRDGYHQYRLPGEEGWGLTQNQRMWGGSYDFVFLDVGAAPSQYDIYPWMNVTYDRVTMRDIQDPPIWDLADDPELFYGNLARHIVDATELLWARKPIYPFQHADAYNLPLYVIVDPTTFSNPASPLYGLNPSDLEASTDEAFIQAAFQDLVPWANVDLRTKFLYLPDDDPAFADALLDAKTRYSAGNADFGILKKYLRDNWDTYVEEKAGARSYPTFMFVLEAPSAGLFAYSDGDELGNSWGVFASIADVLLCARPEQPVCSSQAQFDSPELFAQLWNGLIIHELGHSFGLTHPHDTSGIDKYNLATYEVDWLLDSTSSVMTYRHWLGGFNQFDRDLILRGHAVEIASRLIASDATSEAVVADAHAALELVDEGRYMDALDLARNSWIAAGRPSLAEDIPQLRGEAVSDNQIVSLQAGASPAGGPPVYVPLPIPAYFPRDGVTYVRVPLDAPADATAVLIEYRERDAPTHSGWASSLAVVDSQDMYLTGLWNNGYDKGYVLDLERCRDGCFLELWADSGGNLAYDVTTTFYTP